jgi:hypothetical protein
MTPARTVQNAGDAQNASARHVTNARDPAGRSAARGLAALGAIALGVGGTLAVPVAASAAPAPCEQAQRYAAQSGAELFRLNKLDAGRRDNSAGDTSADVGVAEAKSALVAAATVNAAAVTRLLDADGEPGLSGPVIQQAPPTTAKAVTRTLPKGAAGPLALGRGTLTSRATWDPRMACGAASGGVTRAESAVAGVGIGELVRVPRKARSLSTTAMEPGARTVASAGLTLRSLDLLDGAVRVKVVRQPALTARMSAKDSGRIRYTPPVLEVSGYNIKTHRLDAAGDFVELALSDDDDADDTVHSGTRGAADEGSATAQSGGGESDAAAGTETDAARVRRSAGGGESDAAAATETDAARVRRSAGGGESDAAAATATDAARVRRSAGTGPDTGPDAEAASTTARYTARTAKSAHGAAATGSDDSSATPPPPEPRAEPATRDAGVLDGLLSGLPKLGDLTGGSPLPLPAVPGVPPVAGPAESAPAVGPGTGMRISLGDVRQATSGRAIAAKATAIKITITEDRTGGYGASSPNHSGVVLDLDIGRLEAAAVAPEPAAGVQGAVAAGGKGGSLPITGPGASTIAFGGVTLLLAGVAALALGLRRRRFRP